MHHQAVAVDVVAVAVGPGDELLAQLVRKVRRGAHDLGLALEVDAQRALLQGFKLLVVELAGNSEENFAFAILDVFLQIKRNLFGGAEIFHCIGNCKASFFANTEEVVDTCSRCEDNGREIGDGNSLLAKIFG